MNTIIVNDKLVSVPAETVLYYLSLCKKLERKNKSARTYHKIIRGKDL